MARKLNERTGTTKDVTDGSDDLLKAAEVAEIQGGGVRSVWRQVSAGLLKPIKVPFVGTRFRRSDVEALIAKAEAAAK
jgi:predicted DNA-binding transcriptional regulator AlpA